MNRNSKIGYFIDIEGMVFRTPKVRALFVFVGMIILGSGCTLIKYVPENEYLLKKNEIYVKGGAVQKQEIKNYVKQKPNKRVLGLRFHLWMYNLSNPKKDNWFHEWLRKIGEPPVIFDGLMKERSLNQFKQLFISNGYYDVEVKDTVVLKKQKARVIYTINVNNPYFINRVDYSLKDTSLSRFIYPDTVNSLITPGTRYQLEILQEERKRIEKLLRNQGFYGFTKEHISFQLDSALGRNKVNVLMIIKSPGGDDSTPVYHKRYFINQVKIYPEVDINSGTEGKASKINKYDTVSLNNAEIIYSNGHSISPKLLINTNKIAKDSIYSLENVNQTYRNLSSLRMFRFININFEGGEGTERGLYPLNANIRLVPHKKQKFDISGEFTNSRGNYGLGGNLGYQQKNIFRGAEILDLSFSWTNQWRAKPNSKGYHNYANYGLEAQLMFPKLIIPFSNKINRSRKNYTTKTSVKIGYDYQNWPFYSGTISNIAYGYNWQSGKNWTHIFNPIDVNSVKAIDTSTLNTLYAGNTYLLSIYNSHFVGVTNYSLVYNNQQVNEKQLEYIFMRFNIETAGNIMYAYNKMLRDAMNKNGKYEIFGLEYSQYVKVDVDFRQSFQTSPTNNFVYRVFAGAGLPYGNSDFLPFERQYYSGGATGMRAWRVWSLGPGSHFNDSIYNTGDIKLELNFEQRFKMFWIFEGAIFLDIGNIWSISDKDNREGVRFRFDKFYDDLAVGMGFGLRLDLQHIPVIRLDVGLKLRDPSISKPFYNEPQDISYRKPSRFVLGNKDLREGYDYFAFQIGLGYPF